MPAMKAAGKTTTKVTIAHEMTYPLNPVAPSDRSRFASIARRSPIAEDLQHEECGEKRAADRAERVDAVEKRDPPTTGVIFGFDRPRYSGESSTHEKCRRRQDPRRENQSHDGREKKPQGHRAAGAEVNL